MSSVRIREMFTKLREARCRDSMDTSMTEELKVGCVVVDYCDWVSCELLPCFKRKIKIWICIAWVSNQGVWWGMWCSHMPSCIKSKITGSVVQARNQSWPWWKTLTVAILKKSLTGHGDSGCVMKYRIKFHNVFLLQTNSYYRK